MRSKRRLEMVSFLKLVLVSSYVTQRNATQQWFSGRHYVLLARNAENNYWFSVVHFYRPVTLFVKQLILKPGFLVSALYGTPPLRGTRDIMLLPTTII